jgi:hypothetical protein
MPVESRDRDNTEMTLRHAISAYLADPSNHLADSAPIFHQVAALIEQLQGNLTPGTILSLGELVEVLRG